LGCSEKTALWGLIINAAHQGRPLGLLIGVLPQELPIVSTYWLRLPINPAYLFWQLMLPFGTAHNAKLVRQARSRPVFLQHSDES
jgi:hypothetical protein